MQEVSGVLTMQVSPLLGLLLSLIALITLMVALTSCFDREEGFCMGIMGVGSSWGYLLFLVEN